MATQITAQQAICMAAHGNATQITAQQAAQREAWLCSARQCGAMLSKSQQAKQNAALRGIARHSTAGGARHCSALQRTAKPIHSTAGIAQHSSARRSGAVQSQSTAGMALRRSVAWRGKAGSALQRVAARRIAQQAKQRGEA